MGLPEKMATELLIESEKILKIAKSASHRYYIYTIPKRDGTPRTIMHPAKELKTLQRWLNSRVFDRLPVSSAASAYEQGSSILSNAQMHRANRFLLRVDIRNFFESITYDDVLSLLRRHAKGALRGVVFSDADRILVANIACRERKTVIGAPSSPILANRIMYPLDVRLAKRASDLGVVYTRYADDMFFSSSQSGALDSMMASLQRIITASKSPTLTINDSKTIFSSKKRRRVITGLIITHEDKVSLGREFKRFLRVGLHKATKGEFDAKVIRSLAGTIAYAYSIEPAYVRTILDKYPDQDLTRVGLLVPPRYRRHRKARESRGNSRDPV